MHKLLRADLYTQDDYERIRPSMRASVIAQKKLRRVAIGPHLGLVFENRLTALFQTQEVLRIEGITDESRIAQELATYNQLIPNPGELSATLFLEFTDRREAHRFAVHVGDPSEHISLRLGLRQVKARFLRDAGETGLAAVSYLRFSLGASERALLARPEVDVALQVTHPAYAHRAVLSPATRHVLTAELDGAEHRSAAFRQSA